MTDRTSNLVADITARIPAWPMQAQADIQALLVQIAAYEELLGQRGADLKRRLAVRLPVETTVCLCPETPPTRFDCELVCTRCGKSIRLAELSEMAALCDVRVERGRQITSEGWTPSHDDEHTEGSLAEAALCYAHQATYRNWTDAATYASDSLPGPQTSSPRWPKYWSNDWWKPKTPRRDLVRATALLLAEIERIDRAVAKGELTSGGFLGKAHRRNRPV